MLTLSKDTTTSLILDPLNTSTLSSKRVPQLQTVQHKRVRSVVGSISRYANIPTENLKFNQFIEALFSSKMNNDDIKVELKHYVEAIETNYTGTIRDFRA